MQDRTEGGPGLRRMRAKLGPEGAEALRQDTLAQQAEASARAGAARPITQRDRYWYKDYPTPKSAGLTPRENARLDDLMGKEYALTKRERQAMRKLLAKRERK